MIKQILIGIAVLLFCSKASAEYNGYHVSFDIETNSGKEIEAYTYITVYGIDMDSADNTSYLIRALGGGLRNYGNPDQLKYAKQRIKYEFVPSWSSDGEKSFIFSLSHIDSIRISDIKSIKVNDVIDYTYAVGLWNHLDSKDLKWIQKPPVKSYAFSGYLCSYQIFAHKLSDKNKRIFEKLQETQEKINTYFEKQDNYEIEDGEEIDEDLFDKLIGDLMIELDLEKVIVIEECTC